MLTKICIKCKKEKNLCAFGKRKKYKDGLNSMCYDCAREQDKKYWLKYYTLKNELVSEMKKKEKPIEPTREQLRKAFDEYIKNGGKITKLEYDPSRYQEYSAAPDHNDNVDHFLRGE